MSRSYELTQTDRLAPSMCVVSSGISSGQVAERWECRNGFCDTSGFGGGRREQFFKDFPKIDAAFSLVEFANGRIDAAYLYWFLLRNGEPAACLDTNGRLYKTNGDVHDLVAIYGKHRRIWPVIAEVALDLMP